MEINDIHQWKDVQSRCLDGAPVLLQEILVTEHFSHDMGRS